MEDPTKVLEATKKVETKKGWKVNKKVEDAKGWETK